MRTIGFVTIGQSPRTDVLESMFPGSDTAAWPQAGALDELDSTTINALRPADDEPVLVTRLRDGSEVAISKTRLLPHLESAIARAVTERASRVVVLCTGEFPELRSPAPVVYPDRILRATVDAMYPAGRLGVVMPHAGQRETMLAKWQSPERDVVTATASPYSSAHELDAVGRELTGDGAGLILLDCMGFDEAMRASVASAVDVPVILANRLTGRVLEELMAGAPEQAGVRAG